MPESKTKLAEKLGFRVEVIDGNVVTAFESVKAYEEGNVTLKLWKLCLELSAENENLHKQLSVDGFIPQRPVAEKEKKA